MSRFQSLAMKRVFASIALVLSLGYLVPLFPPPWTISGGPVETSFLRESWIWGVGLLVFNLAGSVLLLRVSRYWTLFALIFCGAQIVIWWQLSGLLATDNSFVEFLPLKARATWELLQHPDFKVRFVALHQDVLVGIFYHISPLWLAAQLVSDWHQPERRENPHT